MLGPSRDMIEYGPPVAALCHGHCIPPFSDCSVRERDSSSARGANLSAEERCDNP